MRNYKGQTVVWSWERGWMGLWGRHFSLLSKPYSKGLPRSFPTRESVYIPSPTPSFCCISLYPQYLSVHRVTIPTPHHQYGLRASLCVHTAILAAWRVTSLSWMGLEFILPTPSSRGGVALCLNRYSGQVLRTGTQDR